MRYYLRLPTVRAVGIGRCVRDKDCEVVAMRKKFEHYHITVKDGKCSVQKVSCQADQDIAEREQKTSVRIAEKGFVPDNSGHGVTRKHITDAAWERWTVIELARGYVEREFAANGVMLVTVEEWDARREVTYYDYGRGALIDGRRWYREDAPNLIADEVRQQIAARDARIAELEKALTDAQSKSHVVALTNSELLAPWIGIDYGKYVNPRDQAAALSFASDPSDPRLGRNSGR